MKSKKGDLSLSINTIVILILAITVLGLGLAFVRTVFKTSTTTLSGTQGTVDQQNMDSFRDKMVSGDKIVDISNAKLAIKAGATQQTFIGFKNDNAADSNFTIKTPIASDISSGACTFVTLEYKNTSTIVSKGVTILPINAKVNAGVSVGTCSYDIPVNSTSSTNLLRTQLIVDIT
jgi:hypothetical protein